MYLGETLVELFGSMRELRRSDADNVVDIIDFMEEQGYMDMRNNPYTAISVLHLAESFRLRGMYIDAFTHCVGMFSQLEGTPGYHLISAASKDLLSRSRTDQDSRLARTATQLRDFARDDLVLSFGLGRTHVDKFRDFLLDFYSKKFGRYPPPSSSRGGAFDKGVYDIMRNDFECLRELLVDERSTHKDATPNRAEADAIRVITAYDFQRGHKTQQNPLPLLPSSVPRRSLWKRLVNRNDKLKSDDDRLLVHATLVRAYNTKNSHVVRNDLVRAYRLFEEDETVAAAGKKALLRAGRMACWLVVYAVCQTLRQVTEVPKEVFDTEGVEYHVAVSTKTVPPWEAAEAGRDGDVFQEPKPAAAGRPKPGEGDPMAPRRTRSISHTARSISKSLRGPSVRRPLSMFIPPPERTPRVQLHPLPTPSATSHSSHEYETAPSTQYTSTSTDPSPSLRDSATTVSSTDLSTPQSSPTRSRPAIKFPAGKPRVREVVSMLETGHANFTAVKPLPERRQRRPRSAVLSNPEVGAWAEEVPGYAVDYAELVERERAAVFGR